MGFLFQAPSEGEGDIFWDDDYVSGSINAWLRRKYRGPYVYGGQMEKLEIARQDIESLLDRFQMMEVRESFSDYISRTRIGDDSEIKVLREEPLIELTLEEMCASLSMEGGIENLLERLEVDKLIANEDESLGSGSLFPVTRELIYNYDFGDDWHIIIRKHGDCRDLLETNTISEQELEKAEEEVLGKHKPVCISKNGLSVLDDVGGLGGFADMLGIMYEEDDKEERSNASAWERSMGWSPRKVFPRKLL